MSAARDSRLGRPLAALATLTAALVMADRRMDSAKCTRRASAFDQTRDVLLRAQSEREPDLFTHVREVARLAAGVARHLRIEAEEIDEIVRAAELHDIGKIAVPDAILEKPGPLDSEEWRLMAQHTLIGARILSAAPAMTPVARIVRSSHEHFDGRGYPDGLTGNEIPLGARIVLACDAFDAMTAHRPYSAPMPQEEAASELRRGAGTQFDPRVVSALLDVLGVGSETVAAKVADQRRERTSSSSAAARFDGFSGPVRNMAPRPSS